MKLHQQRQHHHFVEEQQRKSESAQRMRQKITTLILTCRREALGNWNRYKANLSFILLQNLLVPFVNWRCSTIFLCIVNISGGQCGCISTQALLQRRQPRREKTSHCQEYRREAWDKNDTKRNERRKRKKNKKYVWKKRRRKRTKEREIESCNSKASVGHFWMQPSRDYNESKALWWNRYNGFTLLLLRLSNANMYPYIGRTYYGVLLPK